MSSGHIIHASLQTLAIGHTFLILLIPLFISLFYYSTPFSRRRPIFILNVFALTLGFVIAITTDAIHIHVLLSPRNAWPMRIHIMTMLIANFQMMLVDTILLVRLITVYPLGRVGRLRFVSIMFIPVALKVARVVNMSIYVYQLNSILDSPNRQRFYAALEILPYQKIEWITQVLDNSYASIAFLWTIRSSRVQVGASSNVPFSTPVSRQSSTAKRIRTLFRLALSNFIIPTIISIVQLVMLFRIENVGGLALNNIALVNTMSAVFGVVFATVWAGKEHLREANAYLDPPPIEHQHQNAHRLDGWKADLSVHPSRHEHTATSPENRQGNHVIITSDEDVSAANNKDEELMQTDNVASNLQQIRKSFASETLDFSRPNRAGSKYARRKLNEGTQINVVRRIAGGINGNSV